MPDKKYISELGSWQGFKVGSTSRYDYSAPDVRSEILIELFPDESLPIECSGCEEVVKSVHDRVERWVRDLPAWGADTKLLVHLRRVKCERCGTRMEKVSWLEPYARVTTRLAQSIALLCDVLPVKQAAAYYDVSWHTAKRIHKHYLKKTLGEPDLSAVTVIGLDEFAIEKGHRYATVIVEPRLRRVLWVGRGRKREDIRPFFELLGKEGCERIEAAVMDMWEAFEEEVRAHCKKARIVYDLFHVLSNYGREVIDRTRVDEANRLKDNKAARKVVKGSKWLLLRNKKNIRRHEDRVKLKELLAANKRLTTVYILKDDLKHLWDYTYEGAAARFWNQCYNRAIRSRIEPLKNFGNTLAV